MPPVRIFIPSLTGGVSRQPQMQRRADQCQEMDNVMLALNRGAEKRCGLEFIEGDGTLGALDITSPTSNAAFTHWIDRDPTHQFFIRINKAAGADDVIEAFDLDGNKITVEYDAGDEADVKAYLTDGSGTSALNTVAITIADTTIIANKEVVTDVTGSQTLYQHAGTDVHATANAHNKANGAAFDYPPSASGEYWWARESSVGFPAGPYISQNHTGAQPWYSRVRSESADSEIDATTMPIKLVYDVALNKFVASLIDWKPRYSGDTLTNPSPSFIGKAISGMAIFRDRLFFSAEENLVGSVTSDYFNFWVNDYSNIADDDPIDVQVNTGSINNIQSLTLFNKALVVMTSGAQQFELRSDGALTPASALLLPTTAYASQNINPITMGSQLYFLVTKGASAQLFSYFYSFEVDNNLGGDLSNQVEGYMPNTILKISASENNDLLVFNTNGDTNYVYFLQTYFDGTNRAQAAWFRWQVGDLETEECEVVSHEVFGDWLYIVVRRYGSLFLERASIVPPADDVDADGTMPYSLRLDRKVAVQGTYDSVADETTWSLPYVDELVEDVILGAGFTGKTGTRLIVENTTVANTSTDLVIRGDYSAYDAWVGRGYTKRILLSQQFHRDQQDRAILGTLQLRQMAIAHKDTGTYEVWVTPEGRDTNVFRFSPQRLGSIASVLGQVLLEPSGYFYMKPLCSAAGSTIEIINTAPTPSSISEIEIIGGFVPRKASIAQ